MLIRKISQMITNILVKSNVINSDDEDIYIYGFELCISTVISLLILLAIAIISGMYLESIMFYMVFCLTRLYCGGLHADTYLKCKILFAVTLSFTLFSYHMLKNIAIKPFVWIVVLVVSSVIIILVSPVDNPNKELTASDKRKAKKNTIIILLVWLLVTHIMIHFKMGSFIVVPLTLIVVMVLAVLGLIKQRRRIQ